MRNRCEYGPGNVATHRTAETTYCGKEIKMWLKRELTELLTVSKIQGIHDFSKNTPRSCIFQHQNPPSFLLNLQI